MSPKRFPSPEALAVGWNNEGLTRHKDCALARSGSPRCRHRCGGVFRLVDVATNERDHVGRPFDAGKTRIKHQLRHPRRRLDLGLENVGLPRIQEPLLEQLGSDLIGHRLSGLDEHFVGDTLRLCGEDRHSDGREDVEIVGLARQERLATVADRCELHAGGIDRLALGPRVGLLGGAFRVLRRVRQRQDHRPVVDARHGLDRLLGERAADGADADDGGGLDALGGGDEVPGRRMLMPVRPLEVDKIRAARLQQSVDVEHVDPRLRVLQRHALRNQGGAQQAGQANSCRTSAEEQVLLVLELGALEFGGVDHAGKRDSGRALHVVVIDAIFVAVALEQVDGVRPRPILEMNAAFREHLLHRLDELVDERKKLRRRRAGLAHAQVKRVVQVLHDPLYLGMRKTRPPTPELFSFVDEFVEAVQEVFPKCCIHFEDWTGTDAVHLLERYRDKYCVYNDDVQGTAGITLAGMINAARLKGTKLKDEKYLFLGAGSAGIGLANLLCSALVAQGMTLKEAQSRVYMFDINGLLESNRKDLVDFQKPYAHQHAPTGDFVDAIESIKPSTIIGVSTIGGAFTQKVIESMSRINERPVILALSNPTEHIECTPEQAYTWSKGKAIYAAGVQFEPVHYKGKRFLPGKANNFYIFPAVGMAIFATQAKRVTDEMFIEAGQAVADQVPSDLLKQGLLYPLQSNILETEIQTAARVAKLVFDSGLARVSRPTDVVGFIREHVYNPEYRTQPA